MSRKYYTVKEYAKEHKVSESTVRRWIKEGKVEFIQPYGKKGKVLINV